MSYMKASERAENYKSSAFALLLVGILGIIFLFASLLGIIPIKVAANIKSVGFIAMLIMFVIFIIVGVKSLIEAKTIKAFSDTEDAIIDGITDLFNAKTANEIDSLAGINDEALLSEEKYFKREEIIKTLITEKFGELDESFLDSETERIYNMIFEDK